MTLLHFIVKTVREKFPDVASFDAELKYIEKASTGNAAGFLNIFIQLLSFQHLKVFELTSQKRSA